MSDQIEFEVRIDSDVDTSHMEDLLREEIDSEPNLHVQNIERVKSFGMSGSDVAVSFLVSLVSSAVVQTYREQIDAIAKRVSEKLNAPIKIVFRS